MNPWLHHHLVYNHFPPVDASFVPVAQAAIDHANDGDWDVIVDMPNGISLPVHRIVEELHLEFFLDETD